MKPVFVAIKGKGFFNALRHAADIVDRYGVAPGKLSHKLTQYVQTLDQFGCKATFPITIVALQRYDGIIRQLQEQGIELAVHGHRHLDHSQLSLEKQLNSLFIHL